VERELDGGSWGKGKSRSFTGEENNETEHDSLG